MPKRTHEHVNGIDPKLMSDLAKRGAEMYHQPNGMPVEVPRRVMNPDQQRAVGQMSITDGVPIIREAPEVESSGLGWPEAELNPDYPATDGVGWPE